MFGLAIDPGQQAFVDPLNRCRDAALALRRDAGFVGHDGLYHGGPAGPQQVLERALP